MDNLHHEIESLKTSVRRQRYLNIGLLAVLGGVALLGAARPEQDATFGTITCRELKVVDQDGKAWLEAKTRPNGVASVNLSAKAGAPKIGASIFPDGFAIASFGKITCREWNVVDEDRKTRISAKMLADGSAGVLWLDKDGKVRISAMTFADGEAGVGWLDKDEKLRISATTNANGAAGVQWRDKDGKLRFEAATAADGTTNFPTPTGK